MNTAEAQKHRTDEGGEVTGLVIGAALGLLLNFNVSRLPEGGIVRMALTPDGRSAFLRFCGGEDQPPPRAMD